MGFIKALLPGISQFRNILSKLLKLLWFSSLVLAFFTAVQYPSFAQSGDYDWVDSNIGPGIISFNWEAIDSIGTKVDMQDDGFQAEITMPDFTFFGSQFDKVNISANGFITLGSDTEGLGESNNHSLANPAFNKPKNIIALFWDDLDPGEGGAIHYYNDNDRFIVQYSNMRPYGGSNLASLIGSYTFQVILYLDDVDGRKSGEIVIRYLEMKDARNSATIGIRNDDSSEKLQVAYNTSYVEDSLAVLITTEPILASFTGIYDDGWNMISLPLLTTETHVDSIFNNHFPNSLFSFNGAYVNEDSLDIGTGYWLRFMTADTVNFEGLALDSCTILLQAGWNMIGTPSCDVSVTDVIDPGGIIAEGTYFGFNGAYYNADTLRQKEAYWVFANAAGTITLDCSAPPVSGPGPGLPDLSNESRLFIQDADGKNRSLYFNVTLSDTSQQTSYLMPPVPFSGIFDVRFNGDYRLIQQDEDTIQVQTDHFPLSVTPHNLPSNGYDYYLKEISNSPGIPVSPHLMKEGELINITDPNVTQLEIIKQK